MSCLNINLGLLGELVIAVVVVEPPQAKSENGEPECFPYQRNRELAPELVPVELLGGGAGKGVALIRQHIVEPLLCIGGVLILLFDSVFVRCIRGTLLAFLKFELVFQVESYYCGILSLSIKLSEIKVCGLHVLWVSLKVLLVNKEFVN